MPSFNLVSEPWIPVSLNSGHSDVVSLRDVFIKSAQIKSIECDNPLQTASVVRLVLAVMYRAVTPLFIEQKNHVKNADVALWKMLWDDDSGALSSIASTYLDEWQHRFDLFDSKRPFFQIPNLEYSSKESGTYSSVKYSLGKMMPDADLISVFKNSDFAARVSYAESARILIAYHSWSTMAPLSPVVGMNPSDETAIARFYPKGHRGWCSSIGVTQLSGRNLYETLLLNLVPSQLKKSDMPFWEEKSGKKVPTMYEFDEESKRPVFKQRSAKPAGQVQLFVWFAKSVRLIAEDGMVTSAVSSENNSLSSKSSQVHMARHHETQTAWRESKTGEMAAYYLTEDSVWQNVPALLPRSKPGFQAPLNVTWAAKVSNLLGISLPVRVRIIGASTDDRVQVFRGVIDKSVSVESIARLSSASVVAQLEDDSAKMVSMVKSTYYGFVKDYLTAKYGEVDVTAMKSMMRSAEMDLDRSFLWMFRNISSNTSSTSAAIQMLASALGTHADEVSDTATAKELLGVWRTQNGEKKLFSVASSRARLRRTLGLESMTGPDRELGSYVRWAIASDISVRSNAGDIASEVMKIWSSWKRRSDGSSTHAVEPRLFAFLDVLKNESGDAFDMRVSQMIASRDKMQAIENARSLAGVVIARGGSVDFGSLATLTDAVISGMHQRDIAELIVSR